LKVTATFINANKTWISKGVVNLIYKIFCDGNLNKLKRNYDYVQTLSILEQDNKDYVIGLDIVAENSNSPDETMMCWFSTNTDGSLNYEGYKFLKNIQMEN
jgi:hypothetical protein